MRSLRERLVDLPQIGAVSWIGVRPEHDAPMVALARATIIADRGVDGDVTARSGRPGGKRQVTLFQAEHLAVIAALVGREVTPAMLRRNVVVQGINLLALVNQSFTLGDPESGVVLTGTGPCAPCGKMDDILGPGGFQAMRGHGGITARVERGGVLTLGAAVRLRPGPV